MLEVGVGSVRGEDVDDEDEGVGALDLLARARGAVAVGREGGKVVKTLPKPLHLDHLFADGGRRARLVLEVTRRREVVGMRMRIEDPLQPVALLLDVGEQRVGRVRRGVPIWVEVEAGG